ncbi:hypothetical protein [Fodinicola feengrottensis]|uniref:hypothetical protein n=1 Tax=Fodinicola feengrottensis TaxID=435914 RepID=UPI0036F2A115
MRSLPADLLRHHVFMNLRPMPQEGLDEIIDTVFSAARTTRWRGGRLLTTNDSANRPVGRVSSSAWDEETRPTSFGLVQCRGEVFRALEGGGR